MKRALRLALAVLGFFVFVRATCATKRPGRVTPELRVTISENVPFHNMGIAWDGEYYWTVNGGNAEYSVVNRYDKSGDFEESYDFGIDGRAIGFHAGDGVPMVKGYGTELLALEPEYEDTEVMHEDELESDQGSIGFSPDGSRIYELDDGTVRVLAADDGDELDELEIDDYYGEESGGYAHAIAASKRFLYTWRSETEISVHDLSGKFITSFELPRSGFGFSLSYCNGLLWIAKDADGSTEGAVGKWYGYKLVGLE